MFSLLSISLFDTLYSDVQLICNGKVHLYKMVYSCKSASEENKSSHTSIQ